MLLGPAATAGLNALHRVRIAARRPQARSRPSRADLDRMVMGLAVLLHESLHVTGPAIPEDYHLDPGARALEEGLTEAATVDLLPRYVRSLPLPRALAPRLRAAARRYRPAYRPQVTWVRQMSARATGAGVNSPTARAWRVRAADRWGPERWDLLASTLGTDADALRAGAPAIQKVR